MHAQDVIVSTRDIIAMESRSFVSLAGSPGTLQQGAPHQGGGRGMSAPPRGRGGRPGRGGPRGHLNVMTREEATMKTNVMTGTFQILNFNAFILFNSGAPCSFVSSSFARQLGLAPTLGVEGRAVAGPDARRGSR